MGMNNILIIKNIVFKSGDQITCTIHNNFIKDAKIYILSQEETILDRHQIKAYICQNIKEGWYSPNLLGYKFGWAFGTDNGDRPEFYQIYNLKKIENLNVLLNIVEVSFPKGK
jgi:hypothetical protein